MPSLALYARPITSQPTHHSYNIVKRVGTGSFSSVYRAIETTTGMEVALKATSGDLSGLLSSLQELKVLDQVKSCTYITTMREAFVFREHLFIVTDLLGQSLRQHWLSLKGDEHHRVYHIATVKRLCHDLLSAIAFMDALGLIHCDVKPDNICRDGDGFKLIDLGSTISRNDVANSYTQSRFYRAPEVMLGIPYGTHVDVWSTGVCIVECLIGKALFAHTSVEEMLAAQVRACGPMPDWMIDHNMALSDMFFTTTRDVYQVRADDVLIFVQAAEITIESLLRRSLDDKYGNVNTIVSFCKPLLQLDPRIRPTASTALRHPLLM